jgi:Holliday junction DNA helicase RuvB
MGLDRLDRAVLESLCRRFAGGPVGLATLAVAVGEETETVETVVEPFLVREGLLVRTPRGRAATPAAWNHLGLTPPRAGVEAGQLDLLGAPGWDEPDDGDPASPSVAGGGGRFG